MLLTVIAGVLIAVLILAFLPAILWLAWRLICLAFFLLVVFGSVAFAVHIFGG